MIRKSDVIHGTRQELIDYFNVVPYPYPPLEELKSGTNYSISNDMDIEKQLDFVSKNPARIGIIFYIVRNEEDVNVALMTSSIIQILQTPEEIVEMLKKYKLSAQKES